MSEFLKESDVKKLPCLSKALTAARVPDNLSYLSFAGKEVILPEYLRAGTEDFAFFNRFHPKQLFEDTFWWTIISVCSEGLELKSCRSSVRYAANLFITFASTQQAMDNDSIHQLIHGNLDKILNLLVKYGDFDIIKSLCLLHSFRDIAKIHDIIREKTNANLFKNAALSIENEDEQKNFISLIIDYQYWCVQGLMLAMDLHPILLNNIEIDFTMLSDFDRNKIILHYKSGNDSKSNILIYNFKRILNGNAGDLSHKPELGKIIEYFYRGTSLINEGDQVSRDEIYVFCLAAIKKRDAATLIQLLRCEMKKRCNYYYGDYSYVREDILEAILDNLEMFKELLPVLLESHLGYYFTRKTAELFKNGLPQHEKVQRILGIMIDHFENNHGIHFDILFFPGIKNKDLDSLMSFLFENPDYLPFWSKEVINTVLLIETRTAKIQNFMEILIKTFPDTDFSEAIRLFMEKASFKCIYKLLRNPIFASKMRNSYFHKLNWKFSEIRRIFQNDLMHDIFYPLRHQIWSAAFYSFDVTKIITNLVTHAEVNSYLKFFEMYKMPETNSYVEVPNAWKRNEYILLFEICENNTELALKVMDLPSLIDYIPTHYDSVVNVLKKWLYEDERHQLKRVVDLIKNVQFSKQLVIEIDSLKIDSFQSFYSFQSNDHKGIKLKYNLELIMRELEAMPKENVDVIFRNMAECPHVYYQIVGPYKQIIDKLEDLKKRCPYFMR